MQAIVDKMRSDFLHEYRRARIKGSASQNELFPPVRAHRTITIFFTTFFFFFFFFVFFVFFFLCTRLISRNFGVGIYALKLSTLIRIGTLFFTERLAVMLR